jgi:hypothetical protein
MGPQVQAVAMDRRERSWCRGTNRGATAHRVGGLTRKRLFFELLNGDTVDEAGVVGQTLRRRPELEIPLACLGRPKFGCRGNNRRSRAYSPGPVRAPTGHSRRPEQRAQLAVAPAMNVATM